MTLAPSIKLAAIEFPTPSQEPDARLVNASGIAPSPVASAVSSAAAKTVNTVGSVAAPTMAQLTLIVNSFTIPAGAALGATPALLFRPRSDLGALIGTVRGGHCPLGDAAHDQHRTARVMQ